jgi:DNA-binding Lrp family transcriptional regulator
MRPDRPSGRSPAQIADHNSRALLETLRRSGSLTRNELSTRLGLTIPGITNITQRLLADGLITETRQKIPGASVPTAHYALAPDGAFTIGLRVRDDRCEGVLIDVTGAIRGRASGSSARQVTDALGRELADPARLVGVGVAGEQPAAEGMFGGTAIVAATLAEWSYGPAGAANGLAVVLIEEQVRAGFFFHSRASPA